MEGKSRRALPFPWETLSDEVLLRLRFCDLDLEMRGSLIEKPILRLQKELARRGLCFRPHFWFSTEWFTPDGVPGIAVPFYLAHPRLLLLDRAQMKGVAPENAQTCMRILRHEAGHAIENAYELRKDKRVQAVFGPSARRYPRFYSPQPYSRRYVHNLGQGYAQSHPDEDFAETFAVWLTSKRQWRATYSRWPALQKLKLMDELMSEIAGRAPVVRNTRALDPLPKLRMTLNTHYRRQRRHFLLEIPEVDRKLKWVFRESNAPRASMTASAFLRKIKTKLSRRVSELSGEPQHRVDRVLDEMIFRSRHLKLKVSPSRLPTKNGLPSALTFQTMRFLRAGLYRIAI